jgi:hypothetical protein
MSTVHVTLSEPRPDATLELCGSEGCEPSPVTSLAGDGRSGWSAEFLDAYPVLGYRVTDGNGTVLAEGHIDVEWTRIGGSEQCGGPMEAEVELPVS